MPARSEWKGTLQVAQLRVPVKAFSASSSEPEITLNQLHRHCGQRITQPRICPDHGKVESDAIISGYRVADNCYLPIEPAELEALRPENDKSLTIECFIDESTIDPVFHSGRTLYLVPDGPTGQRPFGVLRDGMKAATRHAFSKIVLSGRERLVLLRPCGKLLAMTVLEYSQRVRATADYESEVAQTTPGKQELELIQQLIDALTRKEFQISHYRDRYQDGLASLIERHIAEANLLSESPFDGNGANGTTDDSALMAILKASLSAAGIGDESMNLKTALASGANAAEAERKGA
jgi:DNA end-binding protein Ku